VKPRFSDSATLRTVAAAPAEADRFGSIDTSTRAVVEAHTSQRDLRIRLMSTPRRSANGIVRVCHVRSDRSDGYGFALPRLDLQLADIEDCARELPAMELAS
jgi:hypothetical protein